jgi:hypothetical protein
MSHVLRRISPSARPNLAALLRRVFTFDDKSR